MSDESVRVEVHLRVLFPTRKVATISVDKIVKDKPLLDKSGHAIKLGQYEKRLKSFKLVNGDLAYINLIIKMLYSITDPKL